MRKARSCLYPQIEPRMNVVSILGSLAVLNDAIARVAISEDSLAP